MVSAGEMIPSDLTRVKEKGYVKYRSVNSTNSRVTPPFSLI
jgi:hypothetical protein